jgi:formate transporter
MSNETQIDAFPPAKLASRMEEAGAARAGLRAEVVFALALLGGVFIALGAAFTSAVTTGLIAAGMGAGAARLLGGLAFCLGVIAVVLTGVELFAGNNLSVMALAGGRVRWRRLLRNWALVFAGNVIGAAAIAVTVFLAQQHFFA